MLKRVILLFLSIFMLELPSYINVAQAAGIDHSECVRAAKKLPLVKLIYNYGNLGFDNTKTTAEISQVCKMNAAGCFHHSFGRYYAEAERKIVNIGGRQCMVPQITLKFDFSGSVIYISSEQSSCTARVILRHELQHFTIWRTAVDEMLREVKISLKNLALRDVYACNDMGGCSGRLADQTIAVANSVVDKWQAISKKNNVRLDEVDHDNETEFAYRSCSPYSLKVISKFR